jgi:hypothetical protein
MFFQARQGLYRDIVYIIWTNQISTTQFPGKNTMQTIYADGIANMTLIDGVIRIDLVNVTSVEKDKDPNIQLTGRVALSLPALIRTHDQLTKMIDKMVADGILTRNTPPAN